MKKSVLIFILYLCSAFLFSQNNNVVLAGTLTYPGQSCANICGYVDSTGREYALVGASNGMSIVDVTVPSSPAEITQISYNNTFSGFAKWKEIKVYKNYAYIVSEAGAGMQIVDLRHLPGTNLFPSKYYTGDSVITGFLKRAHALHIDTTKKFVYVYGPTGLANGGAVVLNIGTDPWNPTYAGQYNLNYVHDGYVDNDTLYGALINDHYFSVIDFTNKANPQVLATQQTPLAFTHNTWPNVAKNVLFTTDEKKFSYLASYDISDLQNISELDRIRTSTDSAIVHNTHIINNYAVTSWYTEGFTIVDVSRPGNMIQVGQYDTYTGTGTGFYGAWGVYPFLPSGTIVVSNMGEGLFVLTPTYVRGCYLEGNIKDSITLANLPNGLIEILSTTETDNTDAAGNYAAGVAVPGLYNVRYSAPGYITRIINNVSLNNGVLTSLDVKLLDNSSGINAVQNQNSFLTVSGNPFSNSCNLNYYLETGAETATLEVADGSGKIIERRLLTGSNGNAEIGNNYESGLYFVSIKTHHGHSVPVKIIKIK